jgi:glycosyltransferase involved in cell wall biosynthesis
MRIKTIKRINVPMVWTLHDMWPFTGGCHYSHECENYKEHCKCCPQLNSKREKDLAYYIFKRKLKNWNKLNLSLVAPSRWMAEKAAKSFIFENRKIEIVPNGLDTAIYKPHNKKIARKVFNISENKKIILYGAINPLHDERKGYKLLSNAIKKIGKYSEAEKLNIIVFGDSKPNNDYNFGVKSYYVGHLYDDYSLALLYSAADVVVAPSIQESFGQTASESMACGTPVVAFGDTGLSDIVDHKVNGYLAKPYLEDDLDRGIMWAISDKKRHKYLSNNARKKAVSKFNLISVAQSYKEIYLKLLNRKS